MPHDPEGMQLTPREAQQHPDTVQLIDRLETALAERDHHSTEARRYRLLAEAADAALKEARSETADALLIADRAQRERDQLRWTCTDRAKERDEARTVARRLYADKQECEHTIRVLVSQIGADAARAPFANGRVYTTYTVPRHQECPHCGVCLDCAPTGAKVYTDDDPGDCRDCGLPLECVRPGKVQCPDAGVCERCGHVTHDGVCTGGCYPKDYSEEP